MKNPELEQTYVKYKQTEQQLFEAISKKKDDSLMRKFMTYIRAQNEYLSECKNVVKEALYKMKNTV